MGFDSVTLDDEPASSLSLLVKLNSCVSRARLGERNAIKQGESGVSNIAKQVS